MNALKKSLIPLMLILFVLLASILFFRFPVVSESPTLIILDTDISSDVDDVGAVAVLHALVNQGKARILGMMVSSGDPWSVPCLDALNTWFGRPDIPIGMIKGKSVQHESKYTAALAAEFPQDIETGEHAPDAVALYRKLLSEQEDGSTVIVTVGYLTNLKNLLQSKPDELSSLGGVALIQRKVKKLVCMGGEYPEGREWNFYQDTASTEFVLNNWPTPIVFSGYEVGNNIMTGSAMRVLPSSHPVRQSYLLYNGITDRPSWDQVTVLYAVEANSDASLISWDLSPYGDNAFDSDGFNKWMVNPNTLNSYLSMVTPSQRAVEIINQLMSEPSIQ